MVCQIQTRVDKLENKQKNKIKWTWGRKGESLAAEACSCAHSSDFDWEKLTPMEPLRA